ncbi:hypothetical protein [Jatrophihabitans lederbergiae]|uniref:DUF3761 domain-containing protein n=1 Tax=Jatrophihabitans lederbergiae TaxID=3075547 RepID=A0ABU2JDM6_9ACTN|nr:hypothetical protein [Jatrophihabitans sp. DSM 44399]MDT0263082.1 hypothetical protein [Jatrophihabitans sp. DSM 44399]
MKEARDEAHRSRAAPTPSGPSSGNRRAARALLDSTDRTTEFQQYTNSPHGTYWCTSQTGTTATGRCSVSPDATCCRRPGVDDAEVYCSLDRHVGR